MLTDLLKRIVSVRDGEVGPMLGATLYGFCIFLGYYVLRPVREERDTSWFESVYELGGALGYMTRNYLLDDLQWDVERCNVFHKSTMKSKIYK